MPKKEETLMLLPNHFLLLGSNGVIEATIVTAHAASQAGKQVSLHVILVTAHTGHVIAGEASL